MREMTKVPNLMASPAIAGMDLRRAVATAQAQAKLTPALLAAKAFAAKVRPDMQRAGQRIKPSAPIVLRPPFLAIGSRFPYPHASKQRWNGEHI